MRIPLFRLSNVGSALLINYFVCAKCLIDSRFRYETNLMIKPQSDDGYRNQKRSVKFVTFTSIIYTINAHVITLFILIFIYEWI